MAIQWAELIETHGALVYRCAWRVLGDRHEAEDLTQEVFTHAWNSPEFAQAANPAGWLRCVTVRRSLNQLRRRRMIEIGDSDITDHRQCKSEFEAKELRAVLREAIAELPERQRLAFSLRYLEEMTNSEIARELNTTTSAISSALHTARRTLARRLAPDFIGD